MRPGLLILIILLIQITVGAQPSLTTTLGIVSVEITDNEYWLETSSLITIVDLEIGFTGLTSFEVDGIEQNLMGDLFVIIDGEPIRVTGIEDDIIQLSLTKGYHSISLLYMGKENFGSVYSMDTIHVDISNSYSEPELTPYDFEYILNDAVVVGEKVDHTITYTDFSYSVRDLTLDSGITANISVNENRIDGYFVINSYGSDVLQSETQFPATRGQVFFADDRGIHKNPSQLFFENDINIGVLVIHEAGVMLGDDYDGIMLDDATGSFDFHIEYQSFGYEEVIPENTTPEGSEETREQTEDITPTEYTPIVSTWDINVSTEEKSPVSLLPFFATLIIIRRRKR